MPFTKRSAPFCSSGRCPMIRDYSLNIPFPYLLKTSENLSVFRCFQRVEKGCIGSKWVNSQTYSCCKTMLLENSQMNIIYCKKYYWINIRLTLNVNEWLITYFFYFLRLILTYTPEYLSWNQFSNLIKINLFII